MPCRPLALDLFCCSGGSTTGLETAGFDVIGIDHKPSAHWTGSGELHEADLSTADAVEAVIRAFRPDFVSSSPPCQRFSSATPTKNRLDHPDLIASTREGILRTGVPAWIENVATDAVPFTGFWVMLCGIHVGLWNLKRHRRFELIGWRTQQPYHDGGLCMYGPAGDGRDTTGVYGFVDAPGSERAKREVLCVVNAGTLWRDEPSGPDVEGRAEYRRQRRVAVAGHGAPDAAQSARYKRREVYTIAGDGGCSPGFGGDKAKRAEWRKRREIATVVSWGGPNDHSISRSLGQNRPGPECIRWREALGWIDGPRDRYSLAQCVPPAYAHWLGERFLEAAP